MSSIAIDNGAIIGASAIFSDGSCGFDCLISIFCLFLAINNSCLMSTKYLIKNLIPYFDLSM